MSTQPLLHGARVLRADEDHARRVRRAGNGVERVVGDEDVRHHEAIRGCDPDDAKAVAEDLEAVTDTQAMPFRERGAKYHLVVGC